MVDNERYNRNVTRGSIYFAEGLLAVFQAWDLKSDISTSISKAGNVIYRVWISGKSSLLQLAKTVYIYEIGNYVNYKRLNKSQHSRELMDYLEYLVFDQQYEIINKL